MIQISRGYMWATADVGHASDHVQNVIDNATSFFDPSHKFKSAWTRARSDGIIHLSVKDGDNVRFPVGLLNRVIGQLNHIGIQTQIHSTKEHNDPRIKFEVSEEVQLRPYQQQAVKDALVHERGIVCCPTGSGKTMMAGLMIAKLGHEHNMFLVHRKELLHQTIEMFKFIFPNQEIGIIGCGKCNVQPITVAMVQTVNLALNNPDIDMYGLEYDEEDRDLVVNRRTQIVDAVAHTDVIFLDECHNIKNNTIYGSLSVFPCPVHIYGMSATPKDQDPTDLMLWAIFDRVIVNIKPIRLIEEGYLLMPIIRFIDVDCSKEQIAVKCTKCKGVTNVHSNYYGETVVCTHCKRNMVFNYGIVHSSLVDKNDTLHNALTTAICSHLKDGRSVAVAVSHVAFGKLLVPKIPDAVLLTASDTDKKRADVFDKLRNGELKCLITTLINEGVDVPALDVICITDGRDDGLYKQRIGRAMRPDPDNPNKKYAYVLDVAYKEAAFISKHSAIRRRVAMDEGFVIL